MSLRGSLIALSLSATLGMVLACSGEDGSSKSGDALGGAAWRSSDARAGSSAKSSSSSNAAVGGASSSESASDGGASPNAGASSVNNYPVPNGGASNSSSTSIAAGGVAIDLCGGNCICSNGIDDDKDGLVDGFDPECTGPLDNDEGTFATGIPGDNSDPKWQDCFFDGNSGAGDDGCRYSTRCLTGELPSSDPDCTVTEECVKFCRPLTSNGCDCFGCCTVQLDDGTTKDIQTSATCSVAKVNDETACSSCVKSVQCSNGCGECELCPGKTIADLPASCSTSQPPPTGGEPQPPAYTCDSGEAVCSDVLPCAAGYCSQGCCISLTLQ